MCRISAIIRKNKNVEFIEIDNLNNSMYRGGPDDDGIYIDDYLNVGIGHRRLSVIDQSFDGHQPMMNNDESIIMSFNGEIYNYNDLKNDLVKNGYFFKSKTDSEVILYGYMEYGFDFFKKLKGMYAIIILDKKNNQFIFLRDPLGIKPLYYAKDNDHLYVSSEIKAIENSDFKCDQNKFWKSLFLTFGFIPEPHTIYKNVFQVPSNSCIIFDLKKNTFDQKTIINFNYNIAENNIDEALKKVKFLLKQSVQRHLISDTPIAILLSGGLDSSILSFISNDISKKNIQAISISFFEDDYDESFYQDLVANKYNIKLFRKTITKEYFIKHIPEIMSAMDVPTIDGVNIFFASKFAKELGIKVLLSGLGADELFGGYDSFNINRRIIFNNKKIFSFLSILNLNQKINKFSFFKSDIWYNEYLFNRGLFTPEQVAKILKISISEVNSHLNLIQEPLEYESIPKNNRNKYFEIKFYLINQLLKDCDFNSMWHGIEIRVPFLDLDILNFCLSFNPDFNIYNGQKKFLLIESYRKELPIEVINRKKKFGFTLPLDKWTLFNEYKFIDSIKLNFTRRFSLYILENKYSYKKL
jgi:asparagine synthase (glutamine-hydrolysing)